MNSRDIEEVDEFVYLGSKITIDGDYTISKARGTFAALKNIWRSSKIRTNTKF